MSLLGRIDAVGFLKRVIPYVLAAVIALAVAGILIAASGKSAVQGYTILFTASFGSAISFQLLILEFIPLFLMALAFAIPLYAGKYNVGNEGQFLMGATGAALVGLLIPGLPSVVGIPLLVTASIAFGAAWAVIPAFMLYKFKVNEIVSTISMNFISYYLVLYVATSSLKDPLVGFPQTLPIPSSFVFPALVKLPRIDLGLVLTIAAPLIVFFFIYRTTLGFRVRASGANSRAAFVYGVKSNLMSSLSLIIGGGIAGLAGGIQVASLLKTLQYGMQSNYAPLSYMAALVAPGSFPGLVIASLFLSVLETGVSALQGATGVPADMGLMIEALLVLLILAANQFKGKRPRWLHL